MNTCGFDAALLDLFLDGALSPAEAEHVQAHLNSCPDCQAYVDDVLAIREFFPDDADVELPADFAVHVMEAVAKAPQSRPRKQPWGKLAAAAACLAVIVMVQQIALPMQRSKNAAAPAAAVEEAAMAMPELPTEACEPSMPADAEAPMLTAAMPSYSAAKEAAGCTGVPLAPDRTANGASSAEMPIAPMAPPMVADAAPEEIAAVCIYATQEEVGPLPEDLIPAGTTADHAVFYLLNADDPFAAVLVERGLLETLPDDGVTIQLEIRSN